MAAMFHVATDRREEGAAKELIGRRKDGAREEEEVEKRPRKTKRHKDKRMARKLLEASGEGWAGYDTNVFLEGEIARPCSKSGELWEAMVPARTSARCRDLARQ
jgi:hypothetical protein